MPPGYIWPMKGYIPKHPYFLLEQGMSEWEVEHVLQLEPEPPSVKDENEYILQANREKNLDYFAFFLHHYEKRLNKRIRQIVIGDAQLRYNPERFLDIKCACVIRLAELVPTYDPDKGAQFTTYVYPFIKETILRYLMEEESWAIASLDIYKQLRTAAWHRNQAQDMETAVQTYMDAEGCTRATAVRYIEDAITIRSNTPFWITDPETREEQGETVDRDDSWNYAEIITGGIRSDSVQDAFWALREDRDRELLEGRSACCMSCGRVAPMAEQITFEDLAIRCEFASPSSAKMAYQRALKKLKQNLLEKGVIRVVQIRRTSESAEGKKITAAVYEYQADCDGEWGEIAFDFSKGEAEIRSLAEWDTVRSHVYAKAVIQHLLDCLADALPKKETIFFPA